MSSMDNEIVRRGYFTVMWNPRDGMLRALSSVSSKRQWVVLRKEKRGNPSTVEIYKSEDQTIAPLRIIHLDKSNFKNITTDERKKTFVLNLNDEVCLFQCSSRADMEDWYRDIMTYGSARNNSINGDSTMVHRSLSNTSSNGRDDFDGVPEDETFPVTLRKSNTMTFNGACLLEILKDFENNKFHISLFTKEEAPRLIVKWQIDHIRQYGSHKSAFKFESGRKSSTGVDWFILDTEYEAAERIHRSVDYWAKHIVDQVSNRAGESIRPSNSAASPITPPGLHMKGTPPSKLLSGSLPRASPSTGGNSIYQKLTNGDTPGVYEKPDRSGVVDKNKASSAKAPAKPPIAAHYQPLKPTAGTWKTEDAYAPLDQQTRIIATGSVERSPIPPRDPTYTTLNPQTQTPRDTYMELGPARQ